MQDFDLYAPAGANKQKRIVGRGQGSGRGTTAGKGNKGQKSRSGGKTYIGFEGGQMPLYRRLAQRGFSNYPFRKNVKIVNIGDIEKKYQDGEIVDMDSLKQKGLVKNAGFKIKVKILGNGQISKKLTVRIDTLSFSAKEKFEKIGGTVVALSKMSKDMA